MKIFGTLTLIVVLLIVVSIEAIEVAGDAPILGTPGVVFVPLVAASTKVTEIEGVPCQILQFDGGASGVFCDWDEMTDDSVVPCTFSKSQGGGQAISCSWTQVKIDTKELDNATGK